MDLNDRYIAKGRDQGKTGHGIAHWTRSLAYFVRPDLHISGSRQTFRPRQQLGHDIANALILIARERPLTEASFAALASDACQLFYFLDFAEDASKRGATSKLIKFEGGVEDIPGGIWTLFTAWLETKFKKNRLSTTYSQCSRVCKAAARHKFGELPPHFFLPPNPYPQAKGADSGNWDKDDYLDDTEYKQIGAALIERLKLASHRLSSARDLLPPVALTSPPDGLPDWPKEASAMERSPQAGASTLAFQQIWDHLVQHRRLAQTAIVGIEEKAFFDVPYNFVSDASLASRINGDNDLSSYNIGMRCTILRAAKDRDVFCSHAEAETLGLSYFNLQTQARQLTDLGWLDCIEVNKRKRFFRANCRTALAQDLHDKVGVLLGTPKMTKTEQRQVLQCALPTRQELLNALGLLLLRTGWNLSTALELKPSAWHRPHPIHGLKGSYVEIFSIKARSPKNYQWAQCSANKPFTSYDIIRRVLAWTEPLRIMLRLQIAELEAQLQSPAASMSPTAKMVVRGELAILRGLKDRAWLTVLEDGRIGDLTCQWRDLDEALQADGVRRSNGADIKFSQAMTRRAFAAFAYEKSGANFVLTKLALGHTDFASLLTYIANQKVRAEQRERWVNLQTALVERFRSGKTTAPEILRSLVREGRLTDLEADRLIEAKFRTSKGTLCADPRAPDPEIDPGHKSGEICGTQDCYAGCSKSFVTFETAIFTAAEITRLEALRGQMDVISWQSSSYCEDLAGLVTIFSKYAPETQRAAKLSAIKRPSVPMFGVPSNFAVRKARHAVKI